MDRLFLKTLASSSVFLLFFICLHFLCGFLASFCAAVFQRFCYTYRISMCDFFFHIVHSGSVHRSSLLFFETFWYSTMHMSYFHLVTLRPTYSQCCQHSSVPCSDTQAYPYDGKEYYPSSVYFTSAIHSHDLY